MRRVDQRAPKQQESPVGPRHFAATSHLNPPPAFCLDKHHPDAHDGLADTLATAEVLASQLARYPHLPRNLKGLRAYCDEVRRYIREFDRWFDRAADGLRFRLQVYLGLNEANGQM